MTHECGTHEVVLDDEGGPLRTHDELLDDFACQDTLFGVEVCGRLVDQEDVRRHTQN